MKCFSVHMRLGIIPGIRLPYPHFNHLMIGSFAYGHTIFRMHPIRREKRRSVMESAVIQWTSRNSSPQIIEGIPHAVRTRHIIHPNSGMNDRNALVMLGAYKSTHRFAYLNEWMSCHEPRNRKHDPVTEIGSGAYGLPWIKELVIQKLCIMKPRSYIALIAKDERRANTYVHWNGQSLSLLRGAIPIITLT